MPRPCRLFSKMLLASIGAGWEMDKLHCNAEAVDQLRFRRILAAKSEHLAKTPERFFPSIDDSEEKSPSADDFDVVVEDDVPVEVHPHHFLYEGHVEGDPQSRVFGSRIDVFDGHIYLSDGNSYTVQKVTKLRTKGLPGGHSIITRDKRSPAEIKKLEKEEEMREEERQKRSEDEEENEEIEKKEREVEDKKRKEDQEKKKMKVEEQRENGKNIKYEDYVKQSKPAMYWVSDGVNFQYKTDLVGYHPYLSVALSALGYLGFALVIFASHKNGIFKNYAHTVFLILTYAFVIDIFETVQNLYFIFNMPPEKNRWASRKDIDRLPTTVMVCTISSWLFVFHCLSVWVDAVVSIYQFVVRFCGKKLKLITLYSTFGIFLTLSVGYFASALIFREADRFGPSGIGPIVCTESYTVNRYALLVGFLSCFGIALITPVFPILTLIKGAVKKHNASNRYNEPKPAIVLGLYAFQQFRFPLLCFLTMLIIKEIRGAVFTTIPDIIHAVFKRDISVTINVDLFHLETGQKKHIEKTFTI